MKHLIPILCMIMSYSATAQQNLVPNPSFEDTIACPSNPFQVTSHCKDWVNFGGTADFCYACGTWVGVPSNPYGSQNAIGNGYCHFYISPTPPASEYIAASIPSMEIGKLYEVSLSISLGEKSRYVSKNIGVLFYDTLIGLGASSLSIMSVSPQVLYDEYGYFEDSVNWVRVTDFFIADSAYDNIAIGGFYNQQNNIVYKLRSSSATNNVCDYYVDSVVVRVVDSFVLSTDDSLFCAGDTIVASYYTPKKFKTGNYFTIELSDNLGSFSSPTILAVDTADTSGSIVCPLPVNITTGTAYKIRIKSSSPEFYVDTVSGIKIASPSSINYSINSNSPVCEAAIINFSVTSNITPSGYNWTGPGGFSSTSATPYVNGVTSINAGNYFAKLMFYGCEVIDTIAVTVIPKPSKPAVTNNGVLCAGDTLQLNASTTTTGVSYSWAGPNSYTSSTQNPVINNSTTAMSGVYTATVTKNGCSNNDTTNVLVKPSPTAVSASTNSPLCAGDTLQLQSTASTSGVTYSWSGPNSFTAATRNSSINNSIPAMTGWYKIIADLNGCSVSDSASAVVYPVPSVPTPSYSNPICVGDSLKLFASNVNGVTYYWSGPNSFSTNTQNPIISTAAISDTGYYKIYTSANGCNSSTDSIHVQVNPTPFVVIFANKDSLCDGDAVIFTALPTNAGTSPQYQWYVNAQAVGNGANTYTSNTIKDMDVIRCDMSDATKCSASFTDPSNDVQMKVLPWLTPSVSISANPNGPLQPNEYITFTANVTNGGNPPLYQWVRNGIDVLGATSDTWSANTLNDNDSVSVEIESTYMCPQPKAVASNGIVVTVLTSVGDVTLFKDLKLYPNPNGGSFTLSASTGSYKEVDLTIVNTMGQVVYTQKLVPHKSVVNEKIRVTSLPAGVYLLKLSLGNAEQVLRFNIR